MSLTLANVLGAMPLKEANIATGIDQIIAYSKQAAPYLQTDDVSKYHIAACVLIHRGSLYTFADPEVVDRALTDLNTIYNAYCNAVKGDPRFTNAWQIMAEAPGA